MKELHSVRVERALRIVVGYDAFVAKDEFPFGPVGRDAQESLTDEIDIRSA